MTNELNTFKKKDKLRKNKKKLRNSIFDDCLKEVINSNKKQIENYTNKNYIIGNCQNNLFQKIKKLVHTQKECNVVVDFRTFMRSDYSEKNFDLENDIKTKHFEKIEVFSKKEIKKLILMVDYVFVLNIKEIMKRFFKDKAIIIKPATIKSENMDEYLLFLLSFENNPTSKCKNSIILKDNIITYNEIDLQKIPCINDFIKFYYEIKNIKGKNDLEYYPLYEPVDARCYCYLTIKSNYCKGGNIALLVADPIFDIEDLNLQIYENDYKYILIIFLDYYLDLDEQNGKLFSKYFFNTEEFLFIHLKLEYTSIIEENNNNLLLFDDINKLKAMIINDGRILFKFKLIAKQKDNDVAKENYEINVDNIIDKNIKIIMDNVKLKDNKNFKLLIYEPFNIIYSYIISKNKNCKIILLNEKKSQEIKRKISTQVKNEVNDNIISYLLKNENEKFDVIILVNNDEKGNEFIEKEKFQLIEQHLKEKGVFCAHLFAKNKYLMERVKNNIKNIFKNISSFTNKSDYICICNNN